MDLLLTNDDGIDGEGLQVLASVLIKAGHTVTVVAPDRNNSAVSHKINMHAPLFLCNRSEEYGYPVYTLSGTPADCVMFALGELKLNPQAILSGINDGMNLGSDCMYSGTIGGAQEGAQNRIPSIALSANYHCTREDFQKAASIVSENLADWFGLAKQCKGALNVNIPVKYEIAGIRLCKTARHDYNTQYVHNDDGSYSVNLSSGTLKIADDDTCDFTLFKKGYITVTPLTLDMTDHTLLDGWKK